MNIRQTSLLLSSILALSFVSMISYKLVGLYNSKLESRDTQSSIQATSILSKAIIELSLERSVMQVALNLDEPINSTFESLLSQQRRISDEGFDEVEGIVRRDDSFDSADSFLEKLNDLRDRIGSIREAADRNIHSKLESRAADAVRSLPVDMKDSIAEMASLPLKLTPLNSSIPAEINALKIVQQSAWEIREYGGRERTYLAIATASGKPFSEIVREEMIKDHKRALEAMSRLEKIAERGKVSEEVAKAIQTTKSTYFEDYRVTRESIINASERGQPLPIGFQQFFNESSDALATAVSLSYLAGDVMTTAVEEERAASTTLFFVFLAALFGVIGICGFQIYYSQFRVSNRILTLSDLMMDLSRGNVEIDLEGLKSSDELGQIARCVEVFKENAIEMKRLENAADEMANEFEENVYGIVRRVEEASKRTNGVALELSGKITESASLSSTAAMASDSAAKDVQTVAAAAEEMSCSLSEIPNTVSQTASRARGCSQLASSTQSKLALLKSAIAEIDNVTQTISGISSQTNLLALNASIEAASSGEAGKGFAVVANEVKTLANQSHLMTDEISKKIESIKESAEQTIAGVNDIIGEITSVDQQTNEMSSVISEQVQTTSEISRSVTSAASLTDEVSQNIGVVCQASGNSESATAELKKAATEMIQESQNLKTSVDAFLKGIRSK
ncbi:MAG: methyl-accepting chemotaxis protein [Opitutales bacterium]